MVIGDGVDQGLAFQHPRLANWFYETRLSPRERKEWDGRYLAWCRSAYLTEQFDHGSLSSQSPYVVQYFGAHLERAQAAVENMESLLGVAWFSAWLGVGAGVSGFLNDVDRVRRAAARANSAAILAGRSPAHIGLEVRSLLVTTSLNARWRKLPSALIIALVNAGMWTKQQAIVVGRDLLSPLEKSRVLSRLSQVPDDPADSWVDDIPLLNQAVQALNDCDQTEAFAASDELRWLAGLLIDEDHRRAIDVARRIAPIIAFDMDRAQMLIRLGKAFPEDGLGSLIEEGSPSSMTGNIPGTVSTCFAPWCRRIPMTIASSREPRPRSRAPALDLNSWHGGLESRKG
ncbi:MAG: hypothetical protein ACREUZ_13945 [Burkholderiales bacterium]